MKYLIVSFFLVTILSCSTDNTSNNENTYFGGEIINPKAKYVLLLKNDFVLDTIYLKENNRFITTLKHLKEGLYTFKHGVEFQYVYLQPTDSVLVRLNTWDFDESLVFSGKGSSKNEFLINLFLQNEKDNKEMLRYFKLGQNEFQQKIDSLAQKRKENFKTFLALEKDEIHTNYKKLINAAIHYPLYSLKEIYPYYNKIVTNKNEFPTINPNFYKFRDSVNLNDESLISFYPYQNYIVSYLYNLSYQNKNITNQNFTTYLLNEIEKHIKLDKFKNTLLKRVVLNDFLKSESTCNINQQTLKVFLKCCTDTAYKKQILNLVHDSKFVKNNSSFKDFEVLNYNKKIKKIKKIIKGKNTVIYFWSTEFMSADYLVSRIKFLEKKYPNVLFIGIQLQHGNTTIETDPILKSLPLKNQFKLTKNSLANQYLTSKYPRTIIVDKTGKVINGFTYLGSNYLTKQLDKLELK
jgi:thiol-disulfide isomerase/thioredoxin